MISKVFGGCVLAFLLLITFEGALSLAVTMYRDVLFQDQDNWYMLSSEFGWMNRPNFYGEGFEHGRNPREFDSRGLVSIDAAQLAADDQRPRIIAIGDSSTFGWGIRAEHTFVEVLDDLLPDFSVINLGVLGYSSFQGYQRLIKQGLPLQPSLLIVSFNYNDRLAVPSVSEVDSEKRFARNVRQTRLEVIKRFYLLRALTRVLRAVGLVDAPPTSTVTDLEDIRILPARVPPEQYRENLVKIAQVAQERHIPIIFLVLGDNPNQTAHLRNGITFLNQSQYDSAINELRIAVGEKNNFSMLAQKYLALAYERTGRLAEAKEVLRAKQPAVVGLHGATPVYLDVEYQQIMRTVANEYGIKLVEGSHALENDPSIYLDFCHPNEVGHTIIGHLLYDAVKDILNNQKSAGLGLQAIAS